MGKGSLLYLMAAGLTALLVPVVQPGHARGMSSASYRMEMGDFNAGGGSRSSAGYAISIDSMGQCVVGGLTGNNYALQGGIVGASTDTAGPDGAVVINSGSQYTNSALVTLALSATDPSGVGGMKISNNPSFAGASWTNYTGVTAWSLTAGDGAKTVYARFKDSLGNESATETGDIILDTTPPDVVISSPVSGAMVGGADCEVSGTASDAGSGVYQVLVSPDGGSTWVQASGTGAWSYDWPLTGVVDGACTLKAKAVDNVGNEESPVVRTVTVDNHAPVSAITDPPDGAFIGGTGCTVAGTATDAGSGVGHVDVRVLKTSDSSVMLDWTAAAGTGQWSLNWPLTGVPDGGYTILSRASDLSGKVETPGPGVRVTVDNTSPFLTEPDDKAVRPASYVPAPLFRWKPNVSVKFKVYFSGTPDFKKKLAVASNGGGMGSTYTPDAASWNKVGMLGRDVCWRVEGATLDRRVLLSRVRTLTLDGTFRDISDIPSTDVLDVPTFECGPGDNTLAGIQFSAEPYFVKPIKVTPSAVTGSLYTYTPSTSAWAKITKLGPGFYWRFTGKLPTGETTFSGTKLTAVGGGPAITDPADGSTLSWPVTLLWPESWEGSSVFTKFTVQASGTEDFPAKPLVLGSSKVGSLIISSGAWDKLTASGSPVYIRVVGTTSTRCTVYGAPCKYYLQ